MSTSLYKARLRDRVEHDCSARPRAADRRNVVRPASRRRSASLSEDEGILMGYGYHRGRDEGQLLLLDCANLRIGGDGPLAAARADGFHGNWAPQD